MDNFDLVIQWLDSYEQNLQQAALNSLDAAGNEAVDFARSKTANMRPPVKKGQGPRQAHPGGWADVSGNLAGAYKHDPKQLTEVLFALTMINGMEYGVFLERKGFWVLSGLFEGFLQEAVSRYFLDAINNL